LNYFNAKNAERGNNLRRNFSGRNFILEHMIGKYGFYILFYIPRHKIKFILP